MDPADFSIWPNVDSVSVWKGLAQEDRRIRGRYMVMVWSLGGSPAFACANAFAEGLEHKNEIERIVARTDDSAIINAVVERLIDELRLPAIGD